MNSRHTLAVVFAAALIIRVLTLAYFLPKLNPNFDADWYRALARNLATGHGFVSQGDDGKLHPQVDRTPVYPLFLAALIHLGGDRLGLFLAAQCFVGAITCAITAALAARWLRPGAVMAAGLFLAIDPNSVIRCSDMRSETLFTFLVVAGTGFLIWRGETWWDWLCAGFLWSLATLCRPIGIGLWVIPVAIGLWRRVPMLRLLVFVVGFVSLIVLWSSRNFAVTGRCFFSTAATANLYVVRASGVEAERLGVSHNEMQDRFVKRFTDIQIFKDRASFDEELIECRRASREIFRAHPVTAAKQFVLGWFQVLLGPGARGLDNSLLAPKRPAKLWPALYVVALAVAWCFALVGALKLGRPAILLPLIVLYFTLLSGGGGGNSRFRVPITPMLAVLAVAGVCGPEKKQ